MFLPYRLLTSHFHSISKMKKIFLSILIIALFQDFCNAQQSIRNMVRREYIFGAGATNFLGDLGGANQIGTNGMKDFDFPAIRPAFVIGYRYRLSESTAYKINFAYAFLAGNDKFTKEPFRNNRNCNFRAGVFEFNTQFEYAVVRERPGHIYILKGVKGLKYIQISSYLFAGAGVMYFNPKGQWGDKWYKLKPLCTEGEGLIPARNKYSNVQFVIPLGVGFKFALSKDWSMGIEYGIRKTFTDYIDDVSKTYFDTNALYFHGGHLAVHFSNPTNLSLGPSPTAPGEQRGDPKDKDAYMFAFVSFFYKIPKGSYTLPKFR